MKIRSVCRSLLLLVLAMVLTGLPAALAADSATGSAIKMMKMEGTVGVSDGSGKSLSPRVDMRLYNGYGVETEASSYSWINLDDSKLAKLDAVSEAGIRQSGKQLELLLVSGGLYFNVSKPLEEDESLNIRTSTMAVGVRGTSGWVRVVDQWRSELYVLEGTVRCSVADPVTGQTKTAEIHGGETAVCVVYPQDKTGDKCDILQERYGSDDIRGFVLTEVVPDAPLCEEIFEDSGIDLRDWPEDPSKRLKEDEDALQEQLDEIEKEQEQQENNVAVDPVWKDPGDGLPTAPVAPADDSDDHSSPPPSPRVLTMPVTDDEVDALLGQGDVSQVTIQPSVNPADNTLTVDSGIHVPAGKTLTLQPTIDTDVLSGQSFAVDGTANLNGNLTNSGAVTVTSPNTLQVSGAFQNSAGGTIHARASGRIVPANGIDNAGTIKIEGTAEITSGAADGTIRNTGTPDMQLVGGIVTNTGSGPAIAWPDISGEISAFPPASCRTDVRSKSAAVLKNKDGSYRPDNCGVQQQSDGYYHLIYDDSPDDQSTGDFIVTGGTYGYNGDYFYRAYDGVLFIVGSAPLEIRNIDPDTPTTNFIVVNSNADIALAGVNIDLSDTGDYDSLASGERAIRILEASTSVTISLAAGSRNILKSGAFCEGIYNEGDLTITGTGSLDVTGGASSVGIGRQYYSADESTDAAKLTIAGGEITARGGDFCAGIGVSSEEGDEIIITGGTIDAYGGKHGAGIGGRAVANGNNITITGGTVNAVGGELGAGIGGGYHGSASNIHISGGIVTAVGGDGGVGIGGASADHITISGGEVTAEGKDVAAIGARGETGETCSYIEISGGTVRLTGGIFGGETRTGWDSDLLTSFVDHFTISGDAVVISDKWPIVVDASTASFAGGTFVYDVDDNDIALSWTGPDTFDIGTVIKSKSDHIGLHWNGSSGTYREPGDFTVIGPDSDGYYHLARMAVALLTDVETQNSENTVFTVKGAAAGQVGEFTTIAADGGASEIFKKWDNGTPVDYGSLDEVRADINSKAVYAEITQNPNGKITKVVVMGYEDGYYNSLVGETQMVARLVLGNKGEADDMSIAFASDITGENIMAYADREKLYEKANISWAYAFGLTDSTMCYKITNEVKNVIGMGRGTMLQAEYGGALQTRSAGFTEEPKAEKIEAADILVSRTYESGASDKYAVADVAVDKTPMSDYRSLDGSKASAVFSYGVRFGQGTGD